MNDPCLKAFKLYLEDIFEEQFDPCSIDHMTKLSIFEAGYEAAKEGRYE